MTPAALLQQEAEELGDQMTELKSERDVCLKEENKIKSSKIEIDQELEKYDGIIKENKAKLSLSKKQVCHYIDLLTALSLYVFINCNNSTKILLIKIIHDF